MVHALALSAHQGTPARIAAVRGARAALKAPLISAVDECRPGGTAAKRRGKLGGEDCGRFADGTWRGLRVRHARDLRGRCRERRVRRLHVRRLHVLFRRRGSSAALTRSRTKEFTKAREVHRSPSSGRSTTRSRLQCGAETQIAVHQQRCVRAFGAAPLRRSQR